MSGGEGSAPLAKTEYSADSLSRSYLEQQRAYYEVMMMMMMMMILMTMMMIMS